MAFNVHGKVRATDFLPSLNKFLIENRSKSLKENIPSRNSNEKDEGTIRFAGLKAILGHATVWQAREDLITARFIYVALI